MAGIFVDLERPSDLRNSRGRGGMVNERDRAIGSLRGTRPHDIFEVHDIESSSTTIT